MNDTLSLKSTLGGIFKKALAFAGLSSMVFGGAALSSADGSPAFNNLADDYSTLQVAANGGTWGASANAQAGDTLSLLVWDHNTNPDAVANNVTVKVALPTAMESSHTVSATVSADNAAAANGSAVINVGSASSLSYVAGSAKFYRNVNGALTPVNFPAGVNGDNVVTSGINLGSQAGCWQYAQAVMIQVKVSGGNAAITAEKTVALVGGSQPYGNTATAQPGDEVGFKILVENTGTAVGTNTLITDTLDSRFTYEPGTTLVYAKQNNSDVTFPIDESKIKKDGQTLTWAWEDMDPTPTSGIYLTFKAKVADKSQFAVGSTNLQNCAKASFTGVSVNTNCVTVTVNRSADSVVSFSLRKEVTTGPNASWYSDANALTSAAPGSTITYRLTLQNTGNVVANNVALKDVLPAGITYAGNAKIYYGTNPNATGTSIDLTSMFGSGYVFNTVTNGTAGLIVLTFDAKLTTTCSGQQNLTNNAQVIYNNSVQAQAHATVIFSCTKGLIITKDVQDPTDNQFKNVATAPVNPGQVITYRIVVSNNGNSTVNNPVLTDVLPQYVTYVANSMTIDGQFMSSAVQTAFFGQGAILTNLTPGMSKQIEYQVRVVDCPNFGDFKAVNVANVSADGVAQISDNATITIEVNKPTLNSVF